MIVRHQKAESIFQMVTSVLAIVTNFTLFVLIRNKSPPSLGGYKFLMMYIALFEIFYACFDFVFLPYIYSNASGMLVILDPWLDLPKDFLQVLNFIFNGSLGMAMVIFATHFAYRYFVVSGNKTWISTKPSKVAVWISIPMMICVLWIVVCVSFLGKHEMSDGFMRYELQAELAYVGPFFDYRLDSAHNFHVYCGLALLFSIGLSCSSALVHHFHFLQTVCFFAIIYFGFKYQSEVRALIKDSTKSYTYKSLQAQLFYVLVAQSMIPFVFVFCPCAVLCISIFAIFSNEYYGKVLTLTNAIYPVFDPLPNMLMVKSYRAALFCSESRQNGRKHLIVPSNNISFISELCMRIIGKRAKVFSFRDTPLMVFRPQKHKYKK